MKLMLDHTVGGATDSLRSSRIIAMPRHLAVSAHRKASARRSQKRAEGGGGAARVTLPGKGASDAGRPNPVAPLARFRGRTKIGKRGLARDNRRLRP